MGEQQQVPPTDPVQTRVGSWALFVETQRARGFPAGQRITVQTFGTEQAGLFGWRAAVRPKDHDVLVFPAGPNVVLGVDLQVYELVQHPPGGPWAWMQAGLLADVLRGPRQELAGRIGEPPAGG